jgi:hypothetical protein
LGRSIEERGRLQEKEDKEPKRGPGEVILAVVCAVTASGVLGAIAATATTETVKSMLTAAAQVLALAAFILVSTRESVRYLVDHMKLNRAATQDLVDLLEESRASMRNTAAAMELTATDVKQVIAAQEQMATELMALRQTMDSDHELRRVTPILKRVLAQQRTTATAMAALAKRTEITQSPSPASSRRPTRTTRSRQAGPARRHGKDPTNPADDATVREAFKHGYRLGRQHRPPAGPDGGSGRVVPLPLAGGQGRRAD